MRTYDGAKEKPVPQRETGQGEKEVRAVIFGEANAAEELVLAPKKDGTPNTRVVSPTKWRADFGHGVAYGASSYGYWIVRGDSAALSLSLSHRGRGKYWIVRGDSAAPLYFSGEEVPVRKVGPTQKFEAEHVYIFRWNADIYLKRLFRTAEGVYAQSINPAVRDMRFRPGNGNDFAVLARVCTTTKQQLLASMLGSKLEPNR